MLAVISELLCTVDVLLVTFLHSASYSNHYYFMLYRAFEIF